MKEILVQLVRNSMYHGIETPASRAANGKDEAGRIELSIEKADGSIVMRVSDDGRGLDFQAIRERAESTGFITRSRAALRPERGKGSTFQITIPAVLGAASASISA